MPSGGAPAAGLKQAWVPSGQMQIPLALIQLAPCGQSAPHALQLSRSEEMSMQRPSQQSCIDGSLHSNLVVQVASHEQVSGLSSSPSPQVGELQVSLPNSSTMQESHGPQAYSQTPAASLQIVHVGHPSTHVAPPIPSSMHWLQPGQRG